MRATVLATLLSLLTAVGVAGVSLPAAGAATFSIHGRVLKGLERVPEPGVPVSLHVVHGEEELPGKTATSGADGRFSFRDVPVDPGHSYFISTEYEGAFYTEGPIEAGGKGEASQDLVVYAVGRDIGAVRVTNHHIIVERKPDELHVTEIMVIENSGDTAYLGTGQDHAGNSGVRLGLPASVKEFKAGMGGDDQSVRVQGRDLASTRPIPPGTRPFSFTYHVPFSGRMDLSHRLYFPTDKFVVLFEDPTLKLESSSLEYGGSRDQGERKFEIYQGSNFPVGAEVTMRVGGASFWSNPKIYPWLLAPFLIVAALVIAAKRGRNARVGAKAEGAARVGAEAEGAARAGEEMRFAAPSASAPTRAGTTGPALGRAAGSDVAAQRISSAAQAATSEPVAATDDDFATVYLYLIEALDRGLERGEFSKESHALIRGNLKRRLETILADLPRTGTR